MSANEELKKAIVKESELLYVQERFLKVFSFENANKRDSDCEKINLILEASGLGPSITIDILTRAQQIILKEAVEKIISEKLFALDQKITELCRQRIKRHENEDTEAL